MAGVLRTILVSLLSLGCAGRTTASDAWPQFRGPACDGHATARGLPLTWSEHQNVAWKTPIHGRGWSSPVVWGDQVWLTTATEDGTQLFAVGVDLASGRIVHDIRVFDVATPREVHATNSHASPTPCIEENRVYVHFGSNGTACLDTRTGAILWQRRDLPCFHLRGPGSSPLLWGDLLFIDFDGFDLQYVVALDKHTGRTVWKTDRQIDYETDDGDFKKAFCTPLVIDVQGQAQLISPAARAALAYDPASGRELWRVRYPTHSATARPIYGAGLVFINTGFPQAEFLAVRPDGSGDVTDTHIAWTLGRGVGSKPSPILVDGRIYMVHDRGTMLCVAARTGDVLWEKRLGGSFSASPIYADDRLYLCDEDGATTVLRPGPQPEIRAVNQLDDGCMASPAAVGQALILRTKTHLYRLQDHTR